ncbi:MAG: NAD-dependent epimerase/dehydratase family protein [Archangium sp.]|nr:NAD-dependent epimerase/dehydratase family protein [Archangium sp.]
MKVLVTGAGGFVGGVVARMLRARGDEVRTVARGDYPDLTRLGCVHVRGDLAEPKVAQDAVAGTEAIIHVAAKAGVWGSAADYEASNVTATQNLLDAAVQHGLQRFVFTSSPSVTFDGGDAVHANESLPYPAKHLAHYPRTKAEAERRVLAANGKNGLRTCALRPHLVYGPGDPHLLPRLVKRAKAGKLAWIGAGNQVDVTYVDNAAHAHLLALDALAGAGASTPLGMNGAGKAYFISQGTPVHPDAWVGALLSAIGVPPVTRRVRLPVAYAAGAVMEAMWSLFGMKGEPMMTRFVAAQLGTSHHYDLTAARRDLGYQLLVNDEEAHRRTVAWLQEELSAGRL